MQGTAGILEKTNKFGVKTKHGKTRERFEAASVSGHRILVGLEPVTFTKIVKGAAREIVYPEGTGFMCHAEQGIHQIFPGGMYDMLRSRGHASRGERYESKDMREMTQLALGYVGRLCSWVFIGDEGKDFTDAGLLALAEDLAPPKRNGRKLIASARLRKAAELRTEKNGKRMPMPSANTATAGAYHLDRRRADVREIFQRINPERLAVFGLVEGVHLRLDDAWRVIRPEELEKPGNAIAIACAQPHPRTAKVMRDGLRPVYEGLREIRVRPLNDLARETAGALVAMRGKILHATSPADVSEEVASMRRSLSVAQAVRTVEMDAIMPLSFMLARWKRLDAVQRELVRARAIGVCATLPVVLEPRFELLPEAMRAKIRDGLALASEVANGRDDADPRKRLLLVKKTLKRLSASLI